MIIKIRRLLWLLPLLIIHNSFAQDQKNESAKQIIQQALNALGKGWDTIRTMKLEGYGNCFVVDQSERFEGPYIPEQVTRSMIIVPGKQLMQAEEKTMVSIFGGNTTYVINDDAIAVKSGGKPEPSAANESLQDRLLLTPDVLFRKALTSTSPRLQKDTVLQKANQYVLFFVHHGFPVRIFINKETYMLTASEITKPFTANYALLWGDARKMVYYSYWNLLDRDIHYPLQTDTYLNDYYIESFLITHWELNPPVTTDSLIIPDSVRLQSASLDKITYNRYVQTMNSKAKEIAKDIWLLPGPCNTTVVKQADGIVVIESSYSSEYGEAILHKVKELYPNDKIKAFIATSDAWFHLGGIRPFATMNIDFYFPYRNEPLINRILSAGYKTNPDLLSQKGRGKLLLKGVKNTIQIGNGVNSVQLFPYRTETGDRMMMVYFPGQRLLYCSDLFQPKGRDGKYWQPHYA